MSVLSQEQVSFFNTNGYLVVEDAVDTALLEQLRADFAAWVEESKSHSEPYGSTINDRPRFDVEAGHSVEVVELIGPNVKFHHSKINSKLPGAKTVVKWHQDFPFTPHSNDDVITALLMVDDVTEENGPLEVVPGSHTGEIHSLWHNDKFTGAIDDAVAEDCQRESVVCKGRAGSVCLMHTRLLHGSAPNLSQDPRTLFICVYSAEDAVPYSPNPMPNKHEGMVVGGERTNRVRSIPYQITLPQLPTGASFFDQQSKHG